MCLRFYFISYNTTSKCTIVAKCTVRGRLRYRISCTVSNRGNFTYRSVPFRRRRNSYTAYTVRDLQFFLYRSIPFQPTPLYRSIPFLPAPEFLYRSIPLYPPTAIPPTHKLGLEERHTDAMHRIFLEFVASMSLSNYFSEKIPASAAQRDREFKHPSRAEARWRPSHRWAQSCRHRPSQQKLW